MACGVVDRVRGGIARQRYRRAIIAGSNIPRQAAARRDLRPKRISGENIVGALKCGEKALFYLAISIWPIFSHLLARIFPEYRRALLASLQKQNVIAIGVSNALVSRLRRVHP